MRLVTPEEAGELCAWGDEEGDELCAWGAEEGDEPVFGARPLKRVIQRALQDPLAELILGGEIHDGDLVPVTAGSDGLLIGERVGASNRPRPDDAVVH